MDSLNLKWIKHFWCRLQLPRVLTELQNNMIFDYKGMHLKTIWLGFIVIKTRENPLRSKTTNVYKKNKNYCDRNGIE